jgi:hypothetical protein
MRRLDAPTSVGRNRTTPARWAVTWFSIFIASTTAIRSPFPTFCSSSDRHSDEVSLHRHDDSVADDLVGGCSLQRGGLPPDSPAHSDG